MVSETENGDARAVRPRGDPVPGTLRAACLVVLVEAVALAGVAVLVLVQTSTSTAQDTLGSVLQAVLALAAAALLVALARALGRLRPGARTPLLVLQLLALPVAYSLWFQGDGHPQYGAPIAVLALLTIFLLFAPPSREALDRAG